MMTTSHAPTVPPDTANTEGARPLSPEAARALKEAEARRAAATAKEIGAGAPAKELGGRDGMDPVRFGDWERNGIASDF